MPKPRRSTPEPVAITRPIPPGLARFHAAQVALNGESWRDTYAKKPKSYTPGPSLYIIRSAADEASLWLLPWRLSNYPGRIAGILSILGDRVHRGTLDAWRKRCSWRGWALRALRQQVLVRMTEGQAILGRLDAQILLMDLREDVIVNLKRGQAEAMAKKPPAWQR